MRTNDNTELGSVSPVDADDSMSHDNYIAEAEAAESTGHLMRVRVRKPVWTRLQMIAEEEADRYGYHVTASDIVRAAIGHYLGLHDSINELRNMPPEELGEMTLVFDGIA